MDCVLENTMYQDLLSKQMTFKEALNIIRADSLLNIGELAERAISIKSGVKLCIRNTPNIDTVTGKQIKHVTVKKPDSGKYYLAYITVRTDAPILCVITNEVSNKQYFLYIPFEAHAHLSGSCINISFGKDGMTPGKSQWWEYQVKDFKTLCNLAKK